jgi:hypothetical protein
MMISDNIFGAHDPLEDVRCTGGSLSPQDFGNDFAKRCHVFASIHARAGLGDLPVEFHPPRQPSSRQRGSLAQLQDPAAALGTRSVEGLLFARFRRGTPGFRRRRRSNKIRIRFKSRRGLKKNWRWLNPSPAFECILPAIYLTHRNRVPDDRE